MRIRPKTMEESARAVNRAVRALFELLVEELYIDRLYDWLAARWDSLK